MFALAQLHVGFGGGKVLPGTHDFGLGLVALGLQGAGVHARQHLALDDVVAFVDMNFGQASGRLAGDLDLGGLQAAVAHAQAFRQAIVA
ncbi:hypothetical protein D9M68_1005310 [compost metagenome]